MAGRESDHLRLDARSLALHQAIAEKIRLDPTVVAHALDNLTRWERTAPGPWIEEWRAILLGPREHLLAMMTAQTESATRLRQSSPFAGVLAPAERRRIYESFAA